MPSNSSFIVYCHPRLIVPIYLGIYIISEKVK